MKKLTRLITLYFITLSLLNAQISNAQYYKVQYAPSADSSALQLGVIYTLWVPEGVKMIRGIIVHQHGAGSIAARSGESAAYDLHWQALAKKWDCALLGPSYQVLNDKTDASPGGAQLWFDPRRGSDKTFLKALDEFAAKTGHPEIQKVPWVLWGHSGGAIWSDVMTSLHPERVAAVWLRSGTAFMWRQRTGFAEVKVPDEVYQVPIMCNPGIQEKDNLIGKGQTLMVQTYRAKNAPISFAYDPLTGHWTGNSRYLAIPFLDACMELRLPNTGSTSQQLKKIDQKKGWLAALSGDQSFPYAAYKGDVKDGIWLPNEAVAKLWMEFVKTGNVSDPTPPPAPTNVRTTDLGDKGTAVTWNAEADLESGIHHFIILRDGQELGNLPAINMVRFQVKPAFQMAGTMNNSGWVNSYNDAPANPVPEMRFVDAWPKDNKTHVYDVITVNTAGLKSPPTRQQ